MPTPHFSSITTCTGHDRHGRYPQALTLADFQHNLAAVQARIAAACQRTGREVSSVRLLPVSKTKPEASLRLAEALDRRLQAEGRALDVFIQVNTSGEASKYGLAPEAVPAFLQALPAMSALRVRGLMTLALSSHDSARVRLCFVCLRRLRDRLRQSAPAGMSLEELSMGMSGDFDIAIEEGATVVRVGQAIFGARPVPDQHYWPGLAGPVEVDGVSGQPLHPN